jgi:putative membrane protein
MSKNNKSLAMAATLTSLLTVGPALIAQTQSTSSSMSKTTTMTTSKLSATDHKFVMEAAVGGMEEVQLGQLAAQKASDPDVKNFGQHMVDDHSKANTQLMQLASQKGVTPPTTLPADKQKDMDKLNALSGAAFDKAYMAMMVKDHKKDVSEFQKESKSGKDSDLKSFASTTLPTLQNHLKMAQDINSRLSKGGSATGASHSGH